MGHELYCLGHLIQAAIAFARTTGDERLLTVARRFADLVDEEFRGGPQTGTDGHPEVEVALVELYRQTGESRYLELADTLTEPARARPVRRGPLRLELLPGRRARPRLAHHRGPRGARPVPRRRRDRSLRRDRRRAAARRDARAVVRRHDGEDVPHRRHRLAPSRRVDRRPPRAAAGPRLLRDVRGDREHHVELADAARDRPEPVRRRARAHPVQRLPLRPLARRPHVLLRQPAAVARRPRAPHAGTRSPAARRTSCACWHRSTSTSRRPRTRACSCSCTHPSTHPLDVAERRPGRAARRDRLPVVRQRQHRGRRAAAATSGRSHSGSLRGPARRASTASASRPAPTRS